MHGGEYEACMLGTPPSFVAWVMVIGEIENLGLWLCASSGALQTAVRLAMGVPELWPVCIPGLDLIPTISATFPVPFRPARARGTPMHAWYSPCMLGTPHAPLGSASVCLPCLIGC